MVKLSTPVLMVTLFCGSVFASVANLELSGRDSSSSIDQMNARALADEDMVDFSTRERSTFFARDSTLEERDPFGLGLIIKAGFKIAKFVMRNRNRHRRSLDDEDDLLERGLSSEEDDLVERNSYDTLN